MREGKKCQWHKVAGIGRPETGSLLLMGGKGARL